MNDRLPASGPVSNSIYRLLLGGLLVISQLCLVLHQLDVEHHTNVKECTICLASHAHDHGLVPGSLLPIAEAAHEAPAVLPAANHLSRSPVRQVARSPPVSALLV